MRLLNKGAFATRAAARHSMQAQKERSFWTEPADTMIGMRITVMKMTKMETEKRVASWSFWESGRERRRRTGSGRRINVTSEMMLVIPIVLEVLVWWDRETRMRLTGAGFEH